MSNDEIVKGVLFKETQTKTGTVFNITFRPEFLDFLMQRIHSHPAGIRTVFFKKKAPTKHTTHVGWLSNSENYTTGVQSAFTKESQDSTDIIDPEIDLDSDSQF